MTQSEGEDTYMEDDYTTDFSVKQDDELDELEGVPILDQLRLTQVEYEESYEDDNIDRCDEEVSEKAISPGESAETEETDSTTNTTKDLDSKVDEVSPS